MEDAIVWIVVAGVVFLIGRGVRNVFRGEGGGCACGTSKCRVEEASKKECSTGVDAMDSSSLVEIGVSQMRQERGRT